MSKNDLSLTPDEQALVNSLKTQIDHRLRLPGCGSRVRVPIKFVPGDKVKMAVSAIYDPTGWNVEFRTGKKPCLELR